MQIVHYLPSGSGVTSMPQSWISICTFRLWAIFFAKFSNRYEIRAMWKNVYLQTFSDRRILKLWKWSKVNNQKCAPKCIQFIVKVKALALFIFLIRYGLSLLSTDTFVNLDIWIFYKSVFDEFENFAKNWIRIDYELYCLPFQTQP